MVSLFAAPRLLQQLKHRLLEFFRTHIHPRFKVPRKFQKFQGTGYLHP